MRTVSSLFKTTFIFKVLCIVALALFSIVIQMQVTHAAYTTGHSSYSDPCDTSDAHTYASVTSRPSYCTNHGSGDFGSGVTSHGSGYSYYKDNTSSDAGSKNSAIKSEIQSLLDRIKALNAQIKSGIPNSDAKPGKTDDIKDLPKACTIPTQTLSIGSKGSDVSHLQTILGKAGHFKGEATGYFGTQTRDAVRSFQKEQGIANSGDERTTGYGRVGEKTKMLLSEKCKKEDTAKAFTLVDVATITSQRIDPIKMAADDEYTHYVITLKDKTVHEVKHGFSPVKLEERFKKIGYTGDLSALLAKVTVLPANVVPKKFVVDDIATITGKAIDPSTGVADDEYTQYTITFKNGAVIEVNGHVGRGTEETRLAPLRKAGYRGTLDVFLAKVTTPVVLGVASTDTEALLREFIVEVDALLKKVE